MSSSRRELIILPSTPVDLSAQPGATASGSLQAFLGAAGASATPLFASAGTAVGGPPAASPASATAPLPGYLYVDADDDQLDNLADDLRKRPDVAVAYVKPRGELFRNLMTPLALTPAAGTPDFRPRQGYFDAAPNGVDVDAARARGARGAGTTVVDLEWNWELNHEDRGPGTVVQGIPHGGTDHGTAVVGVINAQENGFGVEGIAPDTTVNMAAFSGPTATTIINVANGLSPGDIMLLEIHRPGPRHNFANRWDQEGYVAIEWWDDDFVAIQYATSRGIIVVEAAGNGAEDLDDSLYDTPGPGFPTWWTNPYARANRDCGAIIVGAGAPPPGTHGRTHGVGRSRLGFSNFGASLDAQGWGREVTTCGYGDLQGGPDPRRWYSDRFSGTSSASPIVVGVLALVQSMLRDAGQPLLTPTTARALLRATGSPQRGNVAQRIGTLPDLAAIITHLGL